MNNQVRFHFKLNNGKDLAITYNLVSNSLRERWINVVQNRRRNNDLLELKIANKTHTDLPELVDILNNISTKINQYYDRQLPILSNTAEVTREMLNDLHEEFEDYGARHKEVEDAGGYRATSAGRDPNVWPGAEFRVEFHELWLKLNQYIHIAEVAMIPQVFPNYSCLIQYMPFEYGELVKPEDALFLETSYRWGELYLGYNTLGKDWADACHDNDQRLIANDQIKVQKSFCSEVWLNFSHGNCPTKDAEIKFWNWYKTLPVELQAQVPIGNLNELALGRYFMGTLCFDRTFLDFCSDMQEWNTPGSEARRRWNLEVFGKIVEATDIEIL